MRKALLLTLCFFLLKTCLVAQVLNIEKSQPIDEPVEGWNKVMLLKNGNTFFFHFTKKEGIDVTVFGKDRQIVATQQLTSDLWDVKKLKSSLIAGLYEIKGEPVLFVEQNDQGVRTVYRVRFNPVNGSVIKEEEIGALPKPTGMKLISRADLSNILVEVDPVSENYVVMFFDGRDEAMSERMNIVLYDNNHRQIREAHFYSPDPSFTTVNLMDATLDGNKRLFFVFYGAPTSRSQGHFYTGRLNLGDTVITCLPMLLNEPLEEATAIVSFHPATHTLLLLTQKIPMNKPAYFSNGDQPGYSSFLATIDPEDLQILKEQPLTPALNDLSHRILKSDEDFEGTPRQMFINKDKSITILFEENTITSTPGATMLSNPNFLTSLGNIGVEDLDESGNQKNGMVIAKNQNAGSLIHSWYQYDRSRGRWSHPPGLSSYISGFLSFDYIHTASGRYILFNDFPGKGKRPVNGTEKLNTTIYACTDGKWNQFPLFGDSSGKKESYSLYLEASDYQPLTQTYATILLERDGKDREAKLAWITFK